jgi:Spy/CpxP family protein refolding chaperone
MNSLILALSVLLAALVAAPAGAQEPAVAPTAHEQLGGLIDDLAGQFHSLGERLRWHLGEPPGGERPLISFMLGHREDLALSAAQVQALERLRNDFQRNAIRREADIRVAEIDIATLLEAEPVDLAKVEAKMREAGQLRTDLRVARIRVIEEGKSQLTPEQRSRLARLLDDRDRPPARPRRPGAKTFWPPRPERL